MRTRIVLCLLLNLAVGSADAQATAPAEGQRATERAQNFESTPPARPTEERSTEDWLIRGEEVGIVPPVAASTSRRPLLPDRAEERRPPGWIITASPGTAIP